MRRLLFLIILIVCSFHSQTGQAQEVWHKIFPIKQNLLVAPEINRDCKYRFAWNLPGTGSGFNKVLFDSGRFFSENKFLIRHDSALLTELTFKELDLLRPLLNFDSQINKALADAKENGADTLFYLLFETLPSANLFLNISSIYKNGASNAFINLRPESSMAIEEFCGKENVIDPSLVNDISAFKPFAADLYLAGRRKIEVAIVAPLTRAAITNYRYKLKKLPLKRGGRPVYNEFTSLSSEIPVLKPGRYKLSYKISTSDGKLSKASPYSKAILIE